MLKQDSVELRSLIAAVEGYTKEGKVANYIPALGKVNKHHISVAICDLSGNYTVAGKCEEMFTLQSISKVLTLALVLEDWGIEEVFSKVGMEPTGDPFNSITKLETENPSKPLNPMINAGALAITNMIMGKNVEEKWERFLQFVRNLVGENTICHNEEVAKSEFDTSHLNRALCYYMKQNNIITEDVEELMMLYTRQCAIEMSTINLAKIGAVFANNGIDPISGQRFISPEINKICKTFMVTCGMYNASGEFAIKVGIPAKSGVSGGILGIVPNHFGIGIFGPALDKKGNSIAGMKILELMEKKYGFSIFM